MRRRVEFVMVLVRDNQVVEEVVESVALDWARVGAMVRARAMAACERVVVESALQVEGVN